jgi:hypothetical protein
MDVAMPARYSLDQVLALAPDEQVRRAARSAAIPSRWTQLGSNESLVWGRFRGSAKEPYQVTVDLAEPAFRCTCPSRKQPCKHGIALLMLWVKGEGTVAELEAVADFAGEWAHLRAERSARRADRAARTAKEPDAVAQAKRIEQREQTMSDGLDEFERWLRDLVRQGLASARRQPIRFWDGVAARLVDAQMPALAEQVRTVPRLIVTRRDWADELLRRIGRWYLAIEAWRRRASLDPDTLADLRTVLGWPQRSADLAQPSGESTWQVIGLRQSEDERLVAQRTWLRSTDSGELALVLDFAATGQVLAVAHVLGSVVSSSVLRYPGAIPKRVRLADDATVVARDLALHDTTTISGALAQAAHDLAANPWRGSTPMALAGATFAADGERVTVVDARGDALPARTDDADPWRLLALCGGTPTDTFGEWEDGVFVPLTVAVDGDLVSV